MVEKTEDDAGLLSIGDVAARTGVTAATLRMWESRHGFPHARRLPGGHRRYSEGDCAAVAAVVRERETGLSLEAAIERVLQMSRAEETSIFAGLHRRWPELTPRVLPKHAVLQLTRAIEDECCAQADRPLLIGCFQRERFYRACQPRWRAMARTADATIVLARFPQHRRDPAGGPIEIALDARAPLLREWAVICDGPRFAACLSGWEPAGQRVADGLRQFETLWTVEPTLVREAARIALTAVARAAPDLPLPDAAQAHHRPLAPESLRTLTALTNRMVTYLVEAAPSVRPDRYRRA
ncbi:MAG: DICT sensory domain-containing protein [Egibacteraceae bacterium]